MKFRWRNLNINDLMLINLHISLITKRFFRTFDRHSDKTLTLSELLLDINNFSNKIVDVIRKSHELSFKIVIYDTRLNPVIFLVNARPMTSEHCQRTLDDFTICRHLAVESTFPYSIHSDPAQELKQARYTALFFSRFICFKHFRTEIICTELKL